MYEVLEAAWQDQDEEVVGTKIIRGDYPMEVDDVVAETT